MRWVTAVLTARHTPGRHARPAGRPGAPQRAPRRRLYTLPQVPAAWSATVSTPQRPPAHHPRAAAWPGIVVVDESPVRPYVLPAAEQRQALRRGSR
ncbi:hypothetical protein [Streptomyces sp. NPDC095602]|uniref:hypothetical protein n=1 Tax=Streptomyces sp. NPDC095602 TaxID=3155819 RepID=UPI0033255806